MGRRRGFGLLLAGLWACASAAAAPVHAADVPPPRAAAVSTESVHFVSRSVKARLVGELATAPEVVVLGGSRGMKLPPALVTARTGRAAFNCGVTDCRPADVWAFVHLLRHRAPHEQPRYVWILSLEALRPGTTIPPALRMIPELDAYLPPVAYAPPAEAGRSRRPLGKLPATAYVWDADGWLRWGALDQARADGRTLPDLLPGTLRRMRRLYRERFPRLDPGSLAYLADTVAYMNAHGAQPLLVLAPSHRAVRRAVADLGWRARRAEARRWLSALAATCDFTLVDLSLWQGEPWWWRRHCYDGLHPDAWLSRQLLARLLESPWWAGT